MSYRRTMKQLFRSTRRLLGNEYSHHSLVPENAELYTAIGAIYLKLGNADEAFEYFGNAILYDSSFNNVSIIIMYRHCSALPRSIKTSWSMNLPWLNIKLPRYPTPTLR
jgi:hypothetical protein